MISAPLVCIRRRLVVTAALVACGIEGNSIAAGSYITNGRSGVSSAFAALEPISNQFAVGNVAISGQSVLQMTANHSDVDALWVAGKINVLLVLEIINNVIGGRTGLQTFFDLADFIAAIRSVHPWKVVIITGTPRYQNTLQYGPFTLLQCNQEIAACNALLRANYKSIGADELADICAPEGPFGFTGYTDLSRYDTTYFSTADGSDANGPIRVHWTDAGFAYALPIAAAAMARVRA